jgi:hypothetical protein
MQHLISSIPVRRWWIRSLFGFPQRNTVAVAQGDQFVSVNWEKCSYTSLGTKLEPSKPFSVRTHVWTASRGRCASLVVWFFCLDVSWQWCYLADECRLSRWKVWMGRSARSVETLLVLHPPVMSLLPATSVPSCLPPLLRVWAQGNQCCPQCKTRYKRHKGWFMCTSSTACASNLYDNVVYVSLHLGHSALNAKL